MAFVLLSDSVIYRTYQVLRGSRLDCQCRSLRRQQPGFPLEAIFEDSVLPCIFYV